MTTLFTSTQWTDETIGESEYQYAETSDPRVLAVVQYDQYAQISELYDGDAINPIIYVDSNGWGRSFSWVAGYDGGEAETISRAFDRLGHGTAQRYLWIFHGIACEDVSDSTDRSGSWLVTTSKTYREHVGIVDEPTTYAEAREDCLAIAQDLQWALDGEVYGIGYATLEGRRLRDDEPVDLTEWDINIECWGYVGDYAKQAAAAFEAGSPDLPELLAFEAVSA